MRTARVVAVDRDLYTVRPAGGEDIQARLSGRFRHEVEDASQMPCAGDSVAVEISGEVGMIHEVLPRDTVLRRKRPGKDIDFQLIAANNEAARCPMNGRAESREKLGAGVMEAASKRGQKSVTTELGRPDIRVAPARPEEFPSLGISCEPRYRRLLCDEGLRSDDYSPGCPTTSGSHLPE